VNIVPLSYFLTETRQHKNRVSNLQFRLGYSHCFVVDGSEKEEVLLFFGMIL
jgi:hypothetical protein